MVAGSVDINGFAGKHHGRGHIRQVRNEQPGVARRETHPVHQEIGAAANDSRQGRTVTSLRWEKTHPGFREVCRHPASIAAGHVHSPPGFDEPPRDGAAKDSSAAKD